MTKRDKMMVNAMRNLMARGITDEATIVDTAADVAGGGDDAKAKAQRLFDATFKIFTAN